MITRMEQRSLEVMGDPPLRRTDPLPSDGIVLGITTDVVYGEMVELLRLRLASILKIPENAVDCRLSVKEGKIIPEINIEMDDVEGLDPEQVTAVIQSVWWGVQPVRPGIRDELQDRMLDLGARRARETQEGSQETATSTTNRPEEESETQADQPGD